MKLAEFSVKRPITTIMLILIIVVLGGMSLWQLNVELMPKITFPNLTVITEYEGVSSEEIEKALTKPLETAIRSISGIKNVKANSQKGVSVIMSEFVWGTNLDEATNDIRDRIGQIKKYLPSGIADPIIIKVNTSEFPVAFMTVYGNRSLYELQKLTEDVIQPRLERVDGVAGIMLMGGKKREIQINIDKSKLIGYGLSIDMIMNKIRFENINISAGDIKENQFQYNIRSIGEFNNLSEIKNLNIGARGGVPIHLIDIADVVDSFADEKGLSHINGRSSVSIVIQKESDANLVKVSGRIKKIIPQIKRELPSDVTFEMVMDISEMITDSINALKNSAIEGAFLAFAIIFAFLGKIRPTLIVCTAIPVSILFAFIGLYFGGSSINIMSLGGLVLALGRLVDDSIVVMENIFRHRNLGKDAFNAASEGTSEVAVAVISSTLVTVIVFLPILYVKGIAAELFKEFGLAVFYSLMGSLLVAFTMVPMLASKLFKAGIKFEGEKEEGVYYRIKEIYGKILEWALTNKSKVISIAVIVLFITGILFIKTGKEFLPGIAGGKYQIKLKLPVGAPLEETSRMVEKIEEKILKLPDINKLSVSVGSSAMGERQAAMTGMMQGSNNATLFLVLNKKDRITTKDDLQEIFNTIARENPKALIELSPAGGEMFGTGRAVEVKIYGADFNVLKTFSDLIANEIRKIDGVKNVNSSMEQGNPEIVLEFNREKLTRYGLTVAQVADIIRTSVEGQVASIFREKGEEVDIRVRLQTSNRKNLRDINDIPITSPLGFVFPVRDVATAKYTEGPGVIRRENAKRLALISADITGKKKLSQINTVLDKALKKIELPEGCFVEYGGQQKDMGDSMKALFIALLLSMLLVYMILASLYESLIHPLTIMLAIPFAFTGAIFALFITGVGLGVTAFIGLIMLIGIVSTNSIVLIDFIIKNQEKGIERHQAIIEAGKIRLRPILMTAIATLFALLPVALGRAEGMELQIPLGIAVVGGLFSSTILTLIIVPVVYEIFDNLHIAFSKRLHK